MRNYFANIIIVFVIAVFVNSLLLFSTVKGINPSEGEVGSQLRVYAHENHYHQDEQGLSAEQTKTQYNPLGVLPPPNLYASDFNDELWNESDGSNGEDDSSASESIVVIEREVGVGSEYLPYLIAFTVFALIAINIVLFFYVRGIYREKSKAKGR